MSTEPVDISTSWVVDTLKTKALVILDRGLNASQYVYQAGADQLSEAVERVAKKYQTTYLLTMRQGETANQLSEAVERVAKKYQTTYLLTMQQGETAYPTGWLRRLMRTFSLDIMLLPDQGGLDCRYVEDISEVLSSLIFEESCGGDILNVLSSELDSELVFKLEAALRAKIEMQRKRYDRV